MQGKTAIVTGAADGIGLATAALLGSRGAHVLAVDLPGDKLTSAVENLDNVTAFGQDVSGENAAQNIVAAAVDQFGAVDILFNNAGICPIGTLQDVDDTQWQQAFSINVDAILQISRAALEYLKASQAGRIINTASLNAALGGEMLGAYTATKHAVAGLTKTMAIEWGAFGITANYVLPGAIVTGITRDMRDADANFKNFWLEKAPLKRWGQPEDIAKAVAFLASDDAAFITGHGLVVDGGALIKP